MVEVAKEAAAAVREGGIMNLGNDMVVGCVLECELPTYPNIFKLKKIRILH